VNKFNTGVVILTAAMGIAAISNAQPQRARSLAVRSDRAQRISQIIEGKSFSLSTAVAVAEEAARGKAIAAEVDLLNGQAVIAVTIYTSGPAQLQVVQINGATNELLSVGDDESGADSGADSDDSGTDDSDTGDSGTDSDSGLEDSDSDGDSGSEDSDSDGDSGSEDSDSE
jgi:hypothetical protein